MEAKVFVKEKSRDVDIQKINGVFSFIVHVVT